MPDRNDPPQLATRAYGQPLGHWRAAHRVFGWCSRCEGHTPAEEVIAWRTRENAAHEDRETTSTGAHITARAEPDRLCPGCGQYTLTVVTVTVLVDAGERPAGGWALCTACDATPHPLMEVAGG